MDSQVNEVSTDTNEITPQNAKKSLFQPSNITTEIDSKPEKEDSHKLQNRRPSLCLHLKRKT